jgi:hypothetical protein
VSILAFGGEMGFFLPSDANVIEKTAATGNFYDHSYARCYTSVKGGSSYKDSPAISSQTNFWFHDDIQQTKNTNSTTLVRLIEFLDSGGVAWVRLTGNTSDVWQMERWDGSAWVSVGSCVATWDALQTLDIHIVSSTASGTINLYMSGTARILSGTVNLSGFSGVAKVRTWGVVRGINCEIGHSQMVLASESTIGMRVGTIVMTGNGANTDFTGDYTGIDEAVYNDGDEINSGTANQVELYTGTPVPSFTGYTIRALAITARAKNSGAAPTKMRFMLRSGGTNYDSGSDITLDVAYGNFCKVWETNPATSAAFLSSEIASLQYGVKSIT